MQAARCKFWRSPWRQYCSLKLVTDFAPSVLGWSIFIKFIEFAPQASRWNKLGKFYRLMNIFISQFHTNLLGIMSVAVDTRNGVAPLCCRSPKPGCCSISIRRLFDSWKFWHIIKNAPAFPFIFQVMQIACTTVDAIFSPFVNCERLLRPSVLREVYLPMISWFTDMNYLRMKFLLLCETLID